MHFFEPVSLENMRTALLLVGGQYINPLADRVKVFTVKYTVISNF